MRAFAHLLDRLSLTASRNAKLTLTRDFLRETPDPDRGWALAALTGNLSFKAAKAGAIRAAVEARMDAQLFAWSYDYVGDLAETAALVWPARPGANRAPELSEVVEALKAAGSGQAQALIEGWLDALDADGRWALLKLVTRGLRVGLSARLAKQAVADFGGVPLTEIEEIWHALNPPYGDLFAWLEGRGERPDAEAPGRFRPVMLAQALDEVIDLARLDPADYAAEWKWDGIRVQAVRERAETRLYTRTGDEISAAFPDVLSALSFEGVIDGELLVMRGGAVAPFGDLQQRLNRKTADAKLMAKHPAGIRAYDLLQARGRPPRGWWLYLPGFLAAAGMIAYPQVLPKMVDLNSALRPANGLLLIGLALGGGWLARALSTPLAVYLGKSSYAMYILHVPVLWWCLRRSLEFPPLPYIAIVIAISAAVYGGFEEPANRKLRSYLRDRTRRPAPALP